MVDRKKRLQRLKTMVAKVPSEGPRPVAAAVAEDSGPLYKIVPDFQRVQITGDFASGVRE